jgi:hypothetical protein
MFVWWKVNLLMAAGVKREIAGLAALGVPVDSGFARGLALREDLRVLGGRASE